MTTAKPPRWLTEVKNILTPEPPDQGDLNSLPANTQTALQNLRNYSPNWNHPDISPLPPEDQIDWLGRCLAYTMANIPQPDLGWSADNTFLLYWTGDTRHIDVEVWPEEQQAILLAYDTRNPDEMAEHTINLNLADGWRQLAKLAQKAMQHE